jgi:hypothetical protein
MGLRERNAAIYAKVRELGATTARVAFSGGHDEGGPDEVRLFDGEREVPIEHDFELYEQLGAPIYDEYGGFAGAFQASGELRIDAVAETLDLVTLSYVDEEDLDDDDLDDGRERPASPLRSLMARLFGRR